MEATFMVDVSLSPKLSAIPCVLLRIRAYPPNFPSSLFSTLRFNSASSPRIQYKL